jgi:hypothetical protein
MDFTTQHGRDPWNETALHLAASWGPDDTALLLLLQFLDRCESKLVNIKNVNGDTFMHAVARRWCSLPMLPNETLASLCSKVSSKGFNLDICNFQGETFLETFIEQGKAAPFYPRQGLQALTGLSSLLSLEEGVFWAAVMPVVERIIEYIRYLEQKLRALDFLASDYMSLQEQEVALEDARILAIDYQARLLPSPSRSPPSPGQLHGYLECQNLVPVVDSERFEDMLKHGANPNEYNAEGQTCVMVVIQQIRKYRIPEKLGQDLLTLLLSHGADLRLLDCAGNTALHHAARANLSDVVTILIRAGMDMNARNALDETAVQTAAYSYSTLTRSGVDDSGTLYARSQSTLVRLFGNTWKPKTVNTGQLTLEALG